MRYNFPLSGLKSFCECGSPFSVTHALDCKKGGFVAQRHDNLRDLLTHLLSKVCKPVEAEPHLLPVTNEELALRTANQADEARLDIKAHGFWQWGQTAFFDLRVTHVNSSSQRNKSTSNIFKSHEMAKKREYLERVIEVEHGTFTPPSIWNKWRNGCGMSKIRQTTVRMFGYKAGPVCCDLKTLKLEMVCLYLILRLKTQLVCPRASYKETRD